MTRRRLTWTDRSASPAPALPTEAGGHPAAYPDPEADQYQTGDTSAWAEDPTRGPYAQSTPPALPTEAGDHPAAMRQAAQQRRAAEQKAARCIRLAEAMLGSNASVTTIEDQALDFMNLTERQIAAALDRVAPLDLINRGADARTVASSEDALLAEMLREAAEDEEKPADEDQGDDVKDKAAARRAAHYQRRASYWAAQAIGKKRASDVEEKEEDETPADDAASKTAADDAMLAAMLAGEEPGTDAEDEALLAAMMAGEDPVGSEEDALLAEMLRAEEAPMGDETDEDAAMLAEMMASETGAEPAAADPMAGAPADMPMAGMDSPVACGAEEPLMGEDPMGLMDFEGDPAAEAELSELYSGMRAAGEDAEVEEPSEEEAPKEPKQATARARTASSGARPQPRTAATRGVRALGAVAKVASETPGDVSDLSRLWETAPDVSKVFG